MKIYYKTTKLSFLLMVPYLLWSSFALLLNTSILYLNTNDGYTIFEDGTKIESVENRLVTFDSHIKHSGTSCTNQKVRLVLNMNYFAFAPT